MATNRTFAEIRAEREAEKKKNMSRTGQNSTTWKMKRAIGKQRAGVVALKQADLVTEIKKYLYKNMPDKFHHNMKHDMKDLIPALAEHLSGEGLHYVEDKYKLGRNAVSSALKMWFPSREGREEALANLMLDNALHAGMVFSKKADELTPRDAALATGIFSQRYQELRKAQNTNFQPEIPVTLVMSLERTIQRAKQIEAKVIENET